MEIESWILENLCYYDRRNPYFLDLSEFEDGNEDIKPRENCSCDNCFYRRDKLALEIIKLKEKYEN